MHGKGGGKKRKNGRCALDQGQRESPLERLQPKSLIYICASLLPSWHLSLPSVAPFSRSRTRIPPCIPADLSPWACSLMRDLGRGLFYLFKKISVFDPLPNGAPLLMGIEKSYLDQRVAGWNVHKDAGIMLLCSRMLTDSLLTDFFVFT